MSPASDVLPKSVRTSGFRRAKTYKAKNPQVEQLLDAIRSDLLLVKSANGLTWRQIAVKLHKTLGGRSMEVCFTTGGFRQLVAVASALGVKIQVTVR